MCILLNNILNLVKLLIKLLKLKILIYYRILESVSDIYDLYI